MARITVSLPDEVADIVTREAGRLRASVSEVVRTALERHLGLNTGRKRKLPFVALGKSGRRHTARDAEEILAREWTK